MTAPDANEYAWAEDIMAMTATFVAYTGPVGDVLRAAERMWESGPRTTFERAPDLVGGFDPYQEPLLVDGMDGWLVLIAPNGFEFSLPEVVAATSKLGRVVSAYWNVNAVMRFLVGDAGRITRRFDPVIYGDAEGDALPEEADLPFGAPATPLAAMTLLLAERLTGQRLTREWLMGEHDAVVIRRPV